MGVKQLGVLIDRAINGAVYKWPKQDEQLWKWSWLVEDVDVICDRYVNQFRVCVQAGGACGLWPLALAKRFDTVYTFEPHLPNYEALVANVQGVENINHTLAALSDAHGSVSMRWQKGHESNLGAQYIESGGEIPCVMVDDLELDNCDLLYLDLEGAELKAIKGAEKTIKRSSPLIVIEDRQHCMRFGYTQAEVHEHLLSLGYVNRGTLQRGDDSVWSRL